MTEEETKERCARYQKALFESVRKNEKELEKMAAEIFNKMPLPEKDDVSNS